MESQYFLIIAVEREDLILLGREFQSLMEEEKNEFKIGGCMTEMNDKVMWGLVL